MLAHMLPHRMAVYRYSGAVDRFGQPESAVVDRNEPGVKGMTPVVPEAACRLTTPKGGQQFGERSRDVYVVTYTVTCEPNVDVREADRVKVFDPHTEQVLLPDGKITLLRPCFTMNAIHHLELKVSVVRDAIYAQ